MKHKKHFRIIILSLTLMRFLLFIFCLIILSSVNAQKTIKVRKGRTLQGFYQLQTENKIKEFLYFDNNGNIAIIQFKKEKKSER